MWEQFLFTNANIGSVSSQKEYEMMANDVNQDTTPGADDIAINILSFLY